MINQIICKSELFDLSTKFRLIIQNILFALRNHGVTRNVINSQTQLLRVRLSDSEVSVDFCLRP